MRIPMNGIIPTCPTSAPKMAANPAIARPATVRAAGRGRRRGRGWADLGLPIPYQVPLPFLGSS